MTKNNPPIHSSVSIGRATRQCTLQSNGNKTKSFFLHIFPFSFLSASFRCLDIRILRIKCTASQLPTASPPLTDRKTYLVRNRFPSSFCCFDSRSHILYRDFLRWFFSNGCPFTIFFSFSQNIAHNISRESKQYRTFDVSLTYKSRAVSHDAMFRWSNKYLNHTILGGETLPTHHPRDV